MALVLNQARGLCYGLSQTMDLFVILCIVRLLYRIVFTLPVYGGRRAQRLH